MAPQENCDNSKVQDHEQSVDPSFTSLSVLLLKHAAAARVKPLEVGAACVVTEGPTANEYSFVRENQTFFWAARQFAWKAVEPSDRKKATVFAQGTTETPGRLADAATLAAALKKLPKNTSLSDGALQRLEFGIHAFLLSKGSGGRLCPVRLLLRLTQAKLFFVTGKKILQCSGMGLNTIRSLDTASQGLNDYASQFHGIEIQESVTAFLQHQPLLIIKARPEQTKQRRGSFFACGTSQVAEKGRLAVVVFKTMSDRDDLVETLSTIVRCRKFSNCEVQIRHEPSSPSPSLVSPAMWSYSNSSTRDDIVRDIQARSLGSKSLNKHSRVFVAQGSKEELEMAPLE